MFVHKPQVQATHYERHAFHPLRIEGITEQLRQLSYVGAYNVLEIGVGRGLLKHCLSPFPLISHTTLDIAEDLRPDYVGSVTDMPFEDKQFDVVLCCEVLEHLPFSEFIPALQEIRRVASRKVILSLPDKRRHFGIAVCLARKGWLQLEWNPSRRVYRRRPLPPGGEHHWEIGCKGTLGRHVTRAIKDTGFAIERQYRLHRHAWHTFFLLRP